MKAAEIGAAPRARKAGRQVPMHTQTLPTRGLFPTLLLFLSLQGCSVKGMAMNSIADALSGGGTGVYLTDDDPALVGEALPFSLKLMETILQERPDHEALLVATASGFVLYGHGWVRQPAVELQFTDLPEARAAEDRAKKLFLRARGYAGRALELGAPGILQDLREDPGTAAERLGKRGIPAMYWYAAALGSAISSDKNDMDLVADLPVVSALLNRALVLDEGWNSGALHELLLVVSASGSTGEEGAGTPEEHFRRAMELNEGRSIGPLVSMAETVCVQQQDRARFNRLLREALNFDVNAYPEMRLANLISQKRARWLLAETDEFFFDEADARDPGVPIHGGSFRWPRY